MKKTLKKRNCIALNIKNKKRRIFKNSLRKKKKIYNIKYSPKNRSQFLIKNYINNIHNDLDEDDFIPFGSMIDSYDLFSEKSTIDEEEEKIFIC